MKRETEKSIVDLWCIIACVDGLYPGGDLRQAKVNVLRELQSNMGMISASGEQLSALMPSILDKALKGKL